MSESEILAGFTLPRALEAEGARIGIITCEKCGAALVLDPDDEFEVQERHRDWHREQEGADE